MAVFVGVRRDDDFGENLDDLGGGRGVEPAVQGDNSAESGNRIAAQRVA